MDNADANAPMTLSLIAGIAATGIVLGIGAPSVLAARVCLVPRGVLYPCFNLKARLAEVE